MARLSKEAETLADRANALQPEDALTLDTLGVVYSQSNAHAKAVEVFRRAAAQQPQRAGYRFNLATSLTFAGRMDEAEREYEACLEQDPRHWKAWLALSQLRKQSASSTHVERLRVALSSAERDPDGQLYINLALSKVFEDLEDYPQAFDHLVKGKDAHRARRSYSSERDRRVFDALKRPLEAGVNADADAGYPSEEPIFVVGMPRSGTTLVDRILSSHSDVSSAGELQNFGVVLKRASGTHTPFMLDVETVGAPVGWTGRGSERPTSPARGRARGIESTSSTSFRTISSMQVSSQERCRTPKSSA